MKRGIALIVFGAVALLAFTAIRDSVSAVEVDPLLERAMFKREPFFGTEAIVPLPAAEAFEKLERIRPEIGDDPKFLEKIAGVAERLGKFDVAEDAFKRLAAVRKEKAWQLAEFYARRGMFDRQAEVWAARLETGDEADRPEALGYLLTVARRHGLGAYLSTDFVNRVVRNNAGNLDVFDRLIESEPDTDRRLGLIRAARSAFSDDDRSLLKKEVETLQDAGRDAEAEQVYIKSFDPFWDPDISRDFYNLLDRRDRLRAYGRELRDRFRKDPSNVESALRYAHYSEYDYNLSGDSFDTISKRLEAAKKTWTTDELVTVTRMLIRSNNAPDASRFLYTLTLRDDFGKGSPKRAAVLYQLFEMFADAGSARIPIGKGDFRFYSDVARADTDPGILTGIISLLFADTRPGNELAGLEFKLAADFNRAAAYRVFLAFKEEAPASPLLAQMYLDLVRLYSAKKETAVAASLLSEFAATHEKSSDFPLAAIKLADAYAAAGDGQNERAVLQKVLDHFGAKRLPLTPSGNTSGRNNGIDIPAKTGDATMIKDYLDRDEPPVTYAEALDRMVASFSRDRKTAEILALYSAEIGKYPDEEWLYLRRLTWLESAGLTDEQLALYRAALAKFQSRTWQDKLARFLLRQKKRGEFEDLATELAGTLNEEEAADFLAFANRGDVETNLGLALYRRAHERFPHNAAITEGLMRLNRVAKNESEWQRLAAENFFEMTSVRDQFLDDLARRGELRGSLAKIGSEQSAVAELFRAEATARLSDFERAAGSFAKLDELYPGTREFNDRLIELERSFGQRDRARLERATTLARSRADAVFDNSDYRTVAGEILAEAGRYPEANAEWNRIIDTGKGDSLNYLGAASVQWDYYQYDAALKTIERTRTEMNDRNRFAFEAGSIRESLGDRAGALREFMTALADPEKNYQARDHLASLARRSSGLSEFDAAYRAAVSNSGSESRLAIRYGQVLNSIGQSSEADRLIVYGISRTEDADLLNEARSYFAENGRNDGKRAVMRRISETSKSAKRRIESRLAIAASLADEEKKSDARDEAIAIIGDYPNNYGAIIQVADFLRRTGFTDDSAGIVRDALTKSKGRFKPALAKKLAETLTVSGRPDLASAEITKLHEEDPGNTGVFEAVVQTAIRGKDAAGLRRAFETTVAAIRAKTKNKPLLDARIAELRTRMIDAFTRLEDFDSAIDQYIELINREPSNESLTESAIKYTERHGGGARLVAYYEKLAAESFKNYRWNVILARLREASGDDNGAIAEYEKAIINQPELSELQMAVAEIEIRRKNYGDALKRIDKALELSNDEPALLRRKIAILKLAGRTAEIDAVRAKLPPESDPATDKDKFDTARRTALEDKAKAREIFKKAFDELRENPLSGEPKAADIRAYADAMRGELSIGDIAKQLWEIRAKLRSLNMVTDTNRATEARRRLSIIETSLVETVGAIASTVATDDELAALHDDLRARLSGDESGEERARVSALVRDLSQRCGFGDIEEAMLIADAKANPKDNLARLLEFYQKRGAYRKAIDAAVEFRADAGTRASAAKLVGDREKELAALREIYDLPTANADFLERYFTLLLESDPAQLRALSSTASRHTLALINFFIKRGLGDDAHRAVDAADFDKGWKTARHAQIVYALNEKGDRAAAYFNDAVRSAPIGRMIVRKTDADTMPTGEDWFRIARDFGRWRLAQGDQKAAPFLSAMTEGLPESAAQQKLLGEHYLKNNDAAAALERFRLAIDVENAAVPDASYLAAYGAAYWKLGKRSEALAKWTAIIDRGDLGSATHLVTELDRYGLGAEARRLVAPVISKQGEYSDELRTLIGAVADTFDDEKALAAYFIDICRTAKREGDIAEQIAEELEGVNREPFLAIMIRAERDPRGYDSGYEDAFRRSFRDRTVAEAIYDHENDYRIEEPESGKLDRTRELLDSMLKRGAFDEAAKLLADAENWLDGNFARPVWMRVMRIKLEARGGRDILPMAERFVGIDVPGAVEEIRQPNLERFNLIKELEPRLAASYFARRLALGDYDAANFIGLATETRKSGDADGAKRLIELMTEIAGESREEAAREIAGLALVKAKRPDPTRYSADEKLPGDLTARRRIAAEIIGNLGDSKTAAMFRKLLAESPDASPADRIAYAKSIVATDKPTAMRLLIAVVDSYETPRPYRWLARVELWRGDVPQSLPDIPFDAYSQFYQGFLTKNAGTERFVNSMLASPDIVPLVRPELVKAYGRESMPFAALELARTISGAKSDDVLDVLSAAAESVGDLDRAIEFEKARTGGGRAERIAALEKKRADRPKPASDLVIDANRTSEQ